MSTNLYPFLSIPLANFSAGLNSDHKILKSLRSAAKHYHGLFLVRHTCSNNPAASFILNGGEYSGRWLLGRVQKHPNQPGRYEILIRRATTCYYQVVDTNHDLANELRFMALDADAEFADPKGKWISTPDSQFIRLGFTTAREIA